MKHKHKKNIDLGFNLNPEDIRQIKANAELLVDLYAIAEKAVKNNIGLGTFFGAVTTFYMSAKMKQEEDATNATNAKKSESP